jgi:retinol dehydrogenase-12
MNKDINCIITGATDGLGKQTALELAKLDFNLCLVGRNQEKGDALINEIASSTGNHSLKYFNSDLSIIKNLDDLSTQIKKEYDSIDILVNNAGAYFSKYIKTEEGLEKTFALNHLSYFELTHLLLDMIKEGKPGRVINVASSAHFTAKLDMNDIQMKNKYKGWTAYCNSKLMNVLFTYEINKRYKDTNITFNCLHPGFVDTRFGDNNTGLGKKILSIGKKLIAIDVIKGASTSVYLATSDDVSNTSGQFFDKSKPVKSSKVSYRESDQLKVWSYSKEIVDDLKSSLV